ncbi:collagen binding domain-containing protein [Microbacterium sp. NPDC089695]|uniref:MSCRAMM family protein n=1 Tax=Microbacterium sp. NPDC089695 TaxID=3364198 RepID=UPI0038217537
MRASTTRPKARSRARGLLAGAVALGLVLVGAIPATAATTASWATWQPLVGTGGAYTTSVQIAATPALTATMTSDSRAGQVGVISGASVWLAEGTPVGAKYGSSVNQSYLNLRPRADNATSPSTTTYSFANPTPAAGWAFVLGDIDADAVRIQATGPDGQALTAAQLGFQGGFNYCAPGIAGKPSCTGSAADVPTWDPATLTLTGNAGAVDTNGSSAWFEPNVPISSLSFVFTRRSGFPVYQTWFASLARDVTGAVTDPDAAPQAGVTVSLTDANGTVVATTTTLPDGSYAFPGVVAAPGYTARVSAPSGFIAVGSPTQAVDLSTADAVADFVVREIVPVAVSGRVLDDDGMPVPGATVSIDGTLTTTTDAAGFYQFDTVDVGGHTVVVTPPSGFSTTDPVRPIVVPADSEDPIEDIDFTLVENATLSGAVTANGVGVAGVTVTATAPGEPTLTAVTSAGGGYSFPRLPSGAYEVAVTTPPGYTAVGATTRSESVATDDVTGVDFALARLGALSGTVLTDDGDPVSGAVITLDTGAGTQQLTTAADGTYGLGDLAPGTYTLTITPPAGTTVVGSATLTVVITAAGEAIVDQDFTLAVDDVPPVDPGTPGTPGTGAGGSGSGGANDGRLPGTGLGPETFLWAGVGAGVLVLGGVLFAVSRRRSRRDDG